MDVKNKKGQITIFLSIILMAVIVLAGVLIDGSRILTGEVQVKRAADSAIRSALANYDSDLKNGYGIFTLNPNNKEKLQETIKDYMAKDLLDKASLKEENEKTKYINLYDYRIEDISVTPIFNLTENEVMKNQILEYMKFRAPKEFIDGLWEKLSAVNDASKMAEAYKEKTSADKLAGKMANIQQQPKEDGSGTTGDETRSRLGKEATSAIDQLEGYLKTSFADPADEVSKSFAELMESDASGLKNVILDEKTAGVKDEKVDGSKEDPRKGKKEEAVSKLNETKKEDKQIGKEQEMELPSNKKVESKDFTQEDKAYVENGVEYKGDIEKDIEFEEGDFSEKAFGFIGSMGTVLGKGLGGLRDDLYIDEYIMLMFNNATEKKNKDAFFDSEVEYILCGNNSQNANELMIKGQVLVLRFGMDTLHIYMDSEKKALATEIATAVAGWWTGGAGIPVVANLIMCGWGMEDAVSDLADLMNGKSVPFYKSNSKISFSYQDYLRLFLLLKNPDEKLSRLQNLIQLNMQKNEKDFKLGDCNTYVRVEAAVSIKYLFMTQPFMPEDKKTLDGRHKFRVVVYQGY